MDIDQVKELVQLMVEHDLASISLRNGREEITLNRAHANGHAGNGSSGVEMVSPVSRPPVRADAEPAVTEPDSAPVIDAALVPIPSPMVGTLYTSSNPEAPPFVELGGRVSATSVVCIIEAMKVFNEIRADVSGTIEKVLVSNEQAVEYGQPLFLVRPD